MSEIKIQLKKSEVSFVGYTYDSLGVLFTWENRIFRAVYPHKVSFAKELLNSGMIDELVEKKLFPKTTISSICIEDFEFIIEHEKIIHAVYPNKWCFEMMKDAAVAYLEVNKIARKYNYQTIDGHGFNIVFNYCNPMFIDLGSFIPANNYKGWLGLEEFTRFFLYPIYIYKNGNIDIARMALNNCNLPLSHGSYLLHRYILLRFFSQDKLTLLKTYFHKFKTISYYSSEEIKKRIPIKLYSTIIKIKKNGLLPFQKVNLHRLSSKINEIKFKNYQTQWGDYHSQHYVNEEYRLTPRFTRLLEIMKQLNISHVFEVGGNQGLFSQALLENNIVDSVVCSDYDELAINIMYRRLKNKNLNILPIVYNFINPVHITYGLTFHQRNSFDCVVALAITHHLILTQKYPLDSLMLDFTKYTNRYIVVEFMPLGLYSPDNKREYKVPDWYTLDWFKAAFEKHFKLLLEEKLEANRIVMIGEKK